MFIDGVTAPWILEGDIVIMDNYKVHKASWLEQLISSKGAKLLFLSPYSPDLNPIEKCWSKIKSFLRKAKARSIDDLILAFNASLSLVYDLDPIVWFSLCNYPIYPLGT